MKTQFFKITMMLICFLVGNKVKAQTSTCLTYEPARTVWDLKEILETDGDIYLENYQNWFIKIITQANQTSIYASVRNQKITRGTFPSILQRMSIVKSSEFDQSKFYNTHREGNNVFVTNEEGLPSENYFMYSYMDVKLIFMKGACGNFELLKELFDESGNPLPIKRMEPTQTPESATIPTQANPNPNQSSGAQFDTTKIVLSDGKTAYYVTIKNYNYNYNINTNTNNGGGGNGGGGNGYNSGNNGNLAQNSYGNVPNQTNPRSTGGSIPTFNGYDYSTSTYNSLFYYGEYMGQLGYYFPQQLPNMRGGMYNSGLSMYWYPQTGFGVNFNLGYNYDRYVDYYHPYNQHHYYNGGHIDHYKPHRNNTAGGPVGVDGHDDVTNGNNTGGGPNGVGGHNKVATGNSSNTGYTPRTTGGGYNGTGFSQRQTGSRRQTSR